MTFYHRRSVLLLLIIASVSIAHTHRLRCLLLHLFHSAPDSMFKFYPDAEGRSAKIRWPSLAREDSFRLLQFIDVLAALLPTPHRVSLAIEGADEVVACLQYFYFLAC